MCEPKQKKMANDQNDSGQINHLCTANSSGRELPVVSSSASFPIGILPPEMWEVIFTNVESPKDLISCWDATTSWQKILCSNDFLFKMVLSLLLKYLSRQDLLVCSSISISWNTAVDACIQNAEEFQCDLSLSRDQRIALKLKLKDVPDFINRFPLSTFTKSKEKIRNPIPFRRVEIDLLSKHGLPRNLNAAEASDHNHGSSLSWYRNKLKYFFDLHGQLIRNLHMLIDGDGIRFPRHMNLVRLCLKRTVNLRVLQISVSQEHVVDPINENDFLHMFCSTVIKPWPELKHLTVLKVGKDTYQKEFFGPATAYAQQLVIFQFDPQTLLHLEPIAKRFSWLQKIVIMYTDPFWGTEFANFVQSSQCRLKHLTVTFCKRTHLDLSTTEDLMKAGNVASATLETLVFQPHPDHIKFLNYDIDHMKQMRLPKLRVLNVSNFSYPSVELLKKVCPGLEKLIVTPSVVHLNDPQDTKTLESGKFYSELYSKHHFWNELVRIQSVDLEQVYNYELSPEGFRIWKKCTKNSTGEKAGKVYTRAGYERKLEHELTTRIGDQLLTENK